MIFTLAYFPRLQHEKAEIFQPDTKERRREEKIPPHADVLVF